MSFGMTIAALIATAGLFAFANYRSRQPVELGTVRWVPYGGIQFVAIVAVVYMIFYLIQY